MLYTIYIYIRPVSDTLHFCVFDIQNETLDSMYVEEMILSIFEFICQFCKIWNKLLKENTIIFGFAQSFIIDKTAVEKLRNWKLVLQKKIYIEYKR